MITLVLNPGSTSTKVAVYEDKTELKKLSVSHSKDELAKYDDIMDQFDFRYGIVMDCLKEWGYTLNDLDCVISRGGAPEHARTGATVIDERLVDSLKTRPKEPHPAAIGPVIAYKISQETGIPSWIYDPVSADELNPLARVFGVKGIEHDSMCHALNTHAMAIAQANELGKSINDVTYIVCHFGGGNSIGMWVKGQLYESCPGDKGTFSSERCGPLRAEKMVELCQNNDAKTIRGWFHGKGGMVSLLGTNDLRDVEKMIEDGDEYALLCEQAMAYQMAKAICSLIPTVDGAVDGIILTGGGAYWDRLNNDMISHLRWTNIPVYVRPGENEMLSLAEGAYRLMNGEEKAHIYEEEYR